MHVKVFEENASQNKQQLEINDLTPPDVRPSFGAGSVTAKSRPSTTFSDEGDIVCFISQNATLILTVARKFMPMSIVRKQLIVGLLWLYQITKICSCATQLRYCL